MEHEKAVGETRITYVGHGTVLIEMDGVRIITDPVLKRWTGALRRYGPLPDPGVHRHLDAVLISHLHLDHLDRPRSRCCPSTRWSSVRRWWVAPSTRSGSRRSSRRGATRSCTSATWTSSPCTPGTPKRRWVVTPATEPLGFIIQGSSIVYFAGDTALFDEMDQIHERIDVALLPIETWGVRPPEGRHMSPRSAATSLAMLEPRIAVPIHWGTLYLPGSAYAGKEATYAWFRKTRRRPEAFAAMAAEAAPDVEVRLLDPGEALVVPPHPDGPWQPADAAETSADEGAARRRPDPAP